MPAWLFFSVGVMMKFAGAKLTSALWAMPLVSARHRVAGDKFYTLRQGGLHRLDHTALDTGHIRDHRAGADEWTVPFDPVQQHGGVEAEDDAVGLPYQILKIRIFTGADVVMLQGIVQR